MKVVYKNSAMVKGKNFQSENFILSLRLKGAEAVRFWAVFDIAKQRNPYAERTDVTRELLGLDEPKLLTEKDLIFFRTGEKVSPKQKGVLLAEIDIGNKSQTKKKTG